MIATDTGAVTREPGETSAPTPIVRLNLDLGSNLGWARTEGPWIIESGTVKLPDSKARYGQRMQAFRNWIVYAIETFGLKAIIYEQPAGRNFRGLQMTCAQAGIIDMLCEDHDLEYVSVTVTAIKKHACGTSYRIKKPEMLVALQRRALPDAEDPVAFKDEFERLRTLRKPTADQVDAIWLADYSIHNLYVDG